ncbi:MAG: peptidylprolyl isomerase, partial [Caldisericia bacterium]
ISKQIRSGKLTFADAASRYSIDQFTKDNGGEIPSIMASDASGYFWANMDDAAKYEGQGMYPFESSVVSKAYNLSNGQISEPVRTSDSWVIVKKIDYRPATKLSFEDVKDQVKRDTLILKKNETESNWLAEKRGQIDVSIGNPWTKFANWWENSVVAPIEDFGRWVSGLLGKNLSEQSSSSNEVPVDFNDMENMQLTPEQIQQLQQQMQQDGASGTTP